LLRLMVCRHYNRVKSRVSYFARCQPCDTLSKNRDAGVMVCPLLTGSGAKRLDHVRARGRESDVEVLARKSN
jgi:hypothetical protein